MKNNNYTTEEIYNLYHLKIMLYTKNIHVRNVKNFEKIKNSPDWVYFEKFTEKVNKAMGNINPRLFIDALIDFYKGYFNLQLLSHQKGIKIYRVYLKNMMYQNSDENNKHIKDGIYFIADYMIKNNINDFYDYLMENHDIYPVLAKHFYSGVISPQLLCMIPDIRLIIRNYPQDIVNQFFKEFLNDYDEIRNKVIKQPKLKKITDNFEEIVKKVQIKLKKELK